MTAAAHTYEIAEAAFKTASRELTAARNAFARSRSAKRMAAFSAATDAFETALATCIAARDAYEAELLAAEVAADAEAAKCYDEQLVLL